jgi:hypothetical protein
MNNIWIKGRSVVNWIDRGSVMQRPKRLNLTIAALIAVFGFVLSGPAMTPVMAQTKKPNILIIWGDDIGYWNISAYNQGMMGLSTLRAVFFGGLSNFTRQPVNSDSSRRHAGVYGLALTPMR